jgi:hypothetical protein
MLCWIFTTLHTQHLLHTTRETPTAVFLALVCCPVPQLLAAALDSLVLRLCCFVLQQGGSAAQLDHPHVANRAHKQK